MRLNKFLAENTGVSRREADEMISQGKVRVASHETRDTNIAALGQQVQDGDRVFVGNKEITSRAEHVTIILNKPVGYLSSRASQGGDPTVYDLLPERYRALKTAGRLDKDSSGLMILSSDGDLIQRLTHPKFEKVKIYEIELDKPLEPLHQQMISDFGIDLPDGKSRLALVEARDMRYETRIAQKNTKLVTRISHLVSRPRTAWTVTMHEGRNRQIRRTFEALGYTVTALHRTNLGQYALNDLKTGEFREISVQ